MTIWLAPDQLFDGTRLLKGHALQIEGDQIAAITDVPEDAKRITGIVCPGFVDLQVNGGGGILVNTTPTADGIRQIAAAHRRFGTTDILPTVITDHPDVIDRAADAAIATPGLLGIHIEGPHISHNKRGTHSKAFIRPCDDRTMATVNRLRNAKIRVMITLAPEAVTPDQINTLKQMGAVVSVGHTDAKAQDVATAFAAGASCATHLFNAMSPMESRAPGAVGAVINSQAFAGIICDGHHVQDDMIALAIRARPAPDRMFLVSDAMPTVGGPDHFDLYGATIRLTNGRLVNADGALAGAHTTLAEGLVRLVSEVGITTETALRMVTQVPAKCIGAPEVGQLVGRHLRDVIVLDRDLSFKSDLSGLI